MISKYQIENMMNEARNAAEEYEALAKAIRAITRNRKKDGSDFANMQKNFTGCSFNNPRFSSTPGEKTIRISTRTEKGRYVSTEINNYVLVRYAKDMSFDKSRVIDNIPCHEAYVIYNADELEQVFVERANHYSDWAAAYRRKEQQIQLACDIFTAGMQSIEKLFAEKQIEVSVRDLAKAYY